MDDLIGEELRTKYGKPEQVPAGPVLKLLKQEGVTVADPRTAIAYRYPTTEACEAFAAGNLRHHGHESLGPVVTDEGIFGIVLLKPEP